MYVSQSANRFASPDVMAVKTRCHARATGGKRNDMKRMLAVVMALGAIGYAAGLGAGVSAADDANGATARSSVGRSSTARVVYAVGGARAPDIPWYDYTERAGTAYYPGAKRTIVDYPAAAAFNWLPDMYLPAGGRESGSIGQAVDVAAKHLDADI